MRLHVAVAMPEQGGRPAIAATEVLRTKTKRRWHFTVGLVERVQRQSIEGARERVIELVAGVTAVNPCVFVDCGTPQGVALWRSLHKDWPMKTHRPHAYERTRFETTMFASFLEAYADGRVRFRDGLEHRKDLDRALVLYRGGKTSKTAGELDSEDEALVVATCLSLMWPTHGSEAGVVTENNKGSEEVV